MKNYIYALLCLSCLLSATTSNGQANSVELKSGTNVFISAHNSVATAYAAIPATLTQGYIIEITSTYTGANETYPITFVAKAGASTTNTITVRPAAGVSAASITGGSTTGIIVLDDADYVRIDGRAGGLGTTSNLTINNTSMGSSYCGIRLINGACFNAIRYCTVLGAYTGSTSTIGIHINTSTSNVTGNSDNLVEYNTVQGPRNLIYMPGTSGNRNTRNVIQYNDLVNIAFAGIWCTNAGVITIRGNKFHSNVPSVNTSVGIHGILFDSQGDSVFILANKMYDFDNGSLTTYTKGIAIRSVSGTPYFRIANNFISITAANATSSIVGGIEYTAGAITGEFYYNTVRIGGVATSGSSFANAKLSTTAGSVVNSFNNIYINERTGGAGIHQASNIASIVGTITANYNTYASATAVFGNLGGTSIPNFATYQAAAAPQEANSNITPVSFVSATDLHLTGASIGNPSLFGTPIAGITTDIDNDTRVAPYRGADEASNPCVGSPNAPTITTAALTAPVCTGNTITITATNPSPPANIVYQWEQSAASTGPWTSVTGGVGANTLSYTTPAMTVTTWYRIKAICGVNSAVSTAFQVIVGNPAPGAITGSTTFCTGGTQVYSVATVFGATSYTWTLPSGWTGTSTTNSITATPSASAGNVSVTVTSSCGTSAPATLAVTPGTAPAQPGTITGSATFCAGISLTYSVAAVTGATSYTWTLPSGWTGTSTTNSITATTGSVAGNITVVALNNCGTSPVRTLAVTPSSAAPTIGAITGNATPCAGTSQTYSIVSVPGVLNYTWTLPSGWTGSSTTNSITVVVGSAAGNITITGSNGCSNSAPQALAVTVPASVIPSVTISSPNTTICSGTLATFNAVAVNGGNAPSYQWKVNNVVTGANAATFNTITLANNDVVTLTLTSNAACPVPATANSNSIAMTVIPNAVPGININATTPPEICANTSVTFYSNITGGGPTPTYQWLKNNNPVGSNAPTYTASNFADNDTIKCVLTTSALCPSFTSITSNDLGLKVAPVVTPSVTIIMSPASFIAPGQQVTFLTNVTNGGTQPLFQWVKNSLDILGATNATYVTNTLGHNDKVHVRIVSSADCAFPNNVSSNRLTVTLTTSGIATTQGQGAAINLYPNPNNGQFEVAIEFDKPITGKMQVEILNTLGQNIYRCEEAAPAGTTWSKKMNIGNLANGVYMLRLVADGKSSVKRFEINR